MFARAVRQFDEKTNVNAFASKDNVGINYRNVNKMLQTSFIPRSDPPGKVKYNVTYPYGPVRS